MRVTTNPSVIIGDINTVCGTQYNNEKEKIAALMKLQREPQKEGLTVECGSNVRNIVDTHGVRNDLPLTQEQINELVSYAKIIGF